MGTTVKTIVTAGDGETSLVDQGNNDVHSEAHSPSSDTQDDVQHDHDTLGLIMMDMRMLFNNDDDYSIDVRQEVHNDNDDDYHHLDEQEEEF